MHSWFANPLLLLANAIVASSASAQDYVTFTLEAGCAGYAAMADERSLADELLAMAVEHGLQEYEVRHADPTFDIPGVTDNYGPDLEVGFSVGVAFVATQQEVLNIAYRDAEFDTMEARRQARVETAQQRFSEARCARFVGRDLGGAPPER